MAGQVGFAGLLTQHIEDRLQRRHGNEKLSPQTMRAIRATIRETIDGIFSKSNHKLSDVATTWLTDQYFKRVVVGGDRAMNDMVVINEYKLSDLTYDDVALLGGLFARTDLAVELLDELRTRRAS